MEDPKTEEMRITQGEREQAEAEAADAAAEEEATATAPRRADKAAYLRKRLEQRAESERAAESDEDERDWESKREDSAVPDAPPPERDEEG